MKNKVNEALKVIEYALEEEYGYCEEFYFMCSACMANRAFSDLKEALEWIKDE